MAKKVTMKNEPNNNKPMQDEINYTTPTARSSKTPRTGTNGSGQERTETSRIVHSVAGKKQTSAKTKRSGSEQGHELDYTSKPLSAVEPDCDGPGRDDPAGTEPNRVDIRFDSLPQSARETLMKQAERASSPVGTRKHPLKPRTAHDKIQVAANEGPTADILASSLELFNLPKINIHDEAEVRKRIGEFFEVYARRGLKPTVAGLGIALSLDRRRLWEIHSGAKSTNDSVRLMPPEVKGLIKEAYAIMEALWESYTVSGKLNPVTSIFLGKNHYGYVDRMDHVVAPGVEEQTRSAEDIRSRYLNSADEIETEME